MLIVNTKIWDKNTNIIWFCWLDKIWEYLQNNCNIYKNMIYKYLINKKILSEFTTTHTHKTSRLKKMEINVNEGIWSTIYECMINFVDFTHVIKTS